MLHRNIGDACGKLGARADGAIRSAETLGLC
jgi:hypothetical protein